MTEPVNMKNFGGVDFNWNEVKSAKKVKGKDGKETYIVQFQTGVTAQYPLQKGQGASMGSRELTMWQSIDYDTETVLTDIDGAKIKGSKKDDHIIAKNIEDTVIDVAGDNNDDHVDIISYNRSESHYGEDYHDVTYMSNDNSEGNKIVLGNDDTADQKVDFEDKAYTDDGVKITNKKKFTSNSVEGPGIENRF